MSLHATLQRYLRVLPEWRFAPPRVQTRRELQRYGSDYGGYWVDDSLLHASSIVYSLGTGKDISFDLALIERFGVEIQAFDPTPIVSEWLAAQNLPEQFHYHQVAVGSHDGQEAFYLPPREDWVSHSVCQAKQYSEKSVHLPMNRLSTVMQRQGHRSIDLLKMDIEGAEYVVIEEIAERNIRVRQLVVEFHHRFSSIGVGNTRQALALLQNEGMKISHICPRGEVFTLVRAD